MTYDHLLIEKLVEQYVKATGASEFTKTDVAIWAIDNGIWKPAKKSQIQLLCEELSVALRAERKVVDGRKVRQYHCVVEMMKDGYVQTVWGHIDVVTPEFMERSVARRRQTLASKAYQLHSDIIYWNEHKNTGEPLQVLLDFRDDIADRDHGRAGQDDDPQDDESL